MVSLVARYRSPTTFEYASEECADVSVGGMFIKSATPAAAGTLLKLECDSDGQEADPDARIRGVARVVWLRREGNENGPSGMGVKFVKLEPGSRELIDKIVRRLSEAGVHARTITSAAPEGGASPSLQPAADPGPVDAGARSAVVLHGADDPDLGAPHEPATPEVATSAAVFAAGPAPSRSEAPGSGSVWNDDESRTASVPPREDVAPRPSSRPASGSLRPTAPKKPSRFGLRGWAITGLLVLVAVVIADRRGVGGDSEPEPASPAPAAPAQRATGQTPEPAPAEPVVRPTPLPEPTREPTEPARAEPPADAPPENAAPAQPPAAVNAPQPSAAAAPSPSPYAIDFVSRPNGASVTIDEDTNLVTPATLDLAAVPKRIKVTARKPGYKSSSIWLELERNEFELKDGVQRRRVYLTLKPEDDEPR
jgi:hypothetical protein